MPEISPQAADTALFELNRLIDETEDEEPDPLTDQVFQARNELEDALSGSDSANVSDSITVFTTDDTVSLTDSDGQEMVMTRDEFRGVMAQFIKEGGLE